MTRYLLAGGGTAGHVNPLLAVADRIRTANPTPWSSCWNRAGTGVPTGAARGYELLVVDRLPFPRAISASVARFPGRFRAIVRIVRQLITEHAIDVVVGFGGYVSAPAYLAARAEKVPIAIHEANARPGIANRLGSVLTGHVGVASPARGSARARLVGMPLRREIEQLDRPRPGARPWPSSGSTRPADPPRHGRIPGRQAPEHHDLAAAASILGAGWQILHITGEKSDLPASELPGYAVRYCDRMELALAAADLVVSRAGTATVSELIGLGLPAVYVPLAIGNGEQRPTPSQVAAGGALSSTTRDFTPDWVRPSWYRCC